MSFKPEYYLIKVETDWMTFFLDKVLYGRKDELLIKLKNDNFLNSDECKSYELIREDSVEFPEYII